MVVILLLSHINNLCDRYVARTNSELKEERLKQMVEVNTSKWHET